MALQGAWMLHTFSAKNATESKEGCVHTMDCCTTKKTNELELPKDRGTLTKKSGGINTSLGGGGSEGAKW